MEEETKSSLRDYERDLWEMETRQRSFRRFQQVFKIYAVMGALIGIGALATFVGKKLDFNLSHLDQMILIIAGSGFAVSTISALFFLFREQHHSGELNRNRYMNAAAEFLLEWARFENLARERLEAAGREFNRNSIRAITSELLNSKIISSDEMIQLEEVLRFRNSLVHSGNRADPNVLARMTEVLRKVMKRFET